LFFDRNTFKSVYDLRMVTINRLGLFNNYSKIDHQWSNKLKNWRGITLWNSSFRCN